MSKSKHPIALSPLSPSLFLDYILNHHTPPTTIVICSTRAAFLEALQTSLNHPPTLHTDSSTTDPPPPPQHHLLNPTLHQIATTRTLTLAFTPTLSNLRAYLATCPPTSSTTTTTTISKRPILAIYRFASVHHSTADHSAQGLSRTLAVAVEAARMGGQQLVLAEPVGGLPCENGLGGEVGEADAWRERVPLLSGVVGFGLGGESGVVGRTAEVGRVVGRWCRFVGWREVREGVWGV